LWPWLAGEKTLSVPTKEQGMPTNAPVAGQDRVIFCLGEKNFTAWDVMDWAFVHGDLAALWKEFMRAAECDRRANDEGLELDDAAVDEAAVTFRYRHDLITAEETERWLEDRAVALSEFGDYFARQYWARNYSGEISVAERSYSAAAAEERDLFLIDLTLSDELDRLAEEMSFRVAAGTEEKADTGPSSANVSTLREQLATREGIDDLSEWLKQIGRDETWLDEMLAAESGFQRRLASAIDEKALQRELQSMRLNLTRFELETIEVDSRDAAAEVIACVRSDGMEMSEVAEQSRYPFRESEILLEDLPPELQQNFLSAKAGALLEPIAREDGFEVCRVKTRGDPALSDAKVRERLQKQIQRRHFSELVSKHIDWKLVRASSEE
jgi:hypothetical protein